ncbi:NAD(P)/FAD-dependent oxidoreductase [Enterobacterales bacterium endosymbiont of Anomoneura mori]|uniref:NAD(P)/FAD-dependent oxidoreductase n=1 Tax=Enterobacterales bacterium endosymbiont of Anomoneura mori TaxID=3132096 RepID=UPI00399D447D
MNKKKIIIIGGGVSGLELAKNLGNKIGKKINITLIDKNPHHIWKPILHEIATGYLDANINSVNYLDHAYNNNYSFILGNIININKYKKIITYKCNNNLKNYKKISYDILVIALGSISNDFNILGVKKNCFFLDNINQALLLHKKIFNILLNLYENKNKIINIVIIGGGATGIELSTEILNTIKELKKYNYNNLKNKKINIFIIEASNRILSALPIKISLNIHNKLKKLGINILNKTIVIKVYKYGIITKTNIFINANLIIWSAGIKVHNFIKKIKGLETNKINQLIIKSTLQTTLDENIFAIGDCSSLKLNNNNFVPARAQSAHQMSSICYKNILAILNKNSLKSFKYIDKGVLISLSKYNTIGYIIINKINKKIIIKGKIARFLYITLYIIHQIKILGFKKTILLNLMNVINKFIFFKIKIK